MSKEAKVGYKKNIGTILLLSFAGSIIYGLPYFRSYYYDTYQAMYHLTNTQMGLLGSAYGVLGVFSYIIGGVLADKIKAKKLLIFSMIATGLGGLLHLFVNNFYALVVIYGLWGVTSLLTFWPALMKIVRIQATEEEQSRAYGTFEGGRGVFNAAHLAVATAIFGIFQRKAMPTLGIKGIIWFYSLAPLIVGLGALGSVVPTVCLIGMAILAVVVFKKAPSASEYTIATLTPKLNMNSLVAISGITFAYTGAEFTANFASEMKNPQKDYPRAIMIAAGTICVLYVIGSVCMTMLMPTSEIFAYTGTLDALVIACNLLEVPQFFVQIVAFGITLSIFGAVVLYIAQPTKMLFGYSEPGIFPEKITKKNEHDIPEKAILFQAILVSLLLAGVAVFPAVETIYNVLITMTALTSLFPYVLLFAAYIKIKRKKVDKPGLYQMTKNKKWGCFLGYMELVICVIAIVCSALPVMTTFKENVVYEVEMIGGGLLVIVSGLWLWKRSGLKNKTFEIE